MKKIILILLGFLLFVACSNKEENIYSNPEDALRAYFTFLYKGDWKSMASLYGGNEDELTSMNPTIEKKNYLNT
ncbi:hypothetical protein [Paenibacillus ferrarius]|nr:hypothetical protein [Paenibacillus ferrarius]